MGRFFPRSITAKAPRPWAGTATASGGNTTAIGRANGIAQGGGAYFGGDGAISSSRFSGNSVTATGGSASSRGVFVDASGRAYGGGAYFSSTRTTVISSYFSGNSAIAFGGLLARSELGASANADAYAFGGGAFFAASGKVTDSIFFANSVTAAATGTVIRDGKENSPEAEARGGAIFIDCSAPAQFELESTGGNRTVISGNTANGAPSGIHFGRGNYMQKWNFFDTSTDGELTVQAEGDVLMQDPLTVELYNSTVNMATFTMDVLAGAGTFVWGGGNVLDAKGGSTVTFEAGSRTVFSSNFTLGATVGKTYRIGSDTDAYARETDPAKNTNDLTVVLDGGAALAFDAARDPETALFDFTGSTNGVFNGNNATLGMDFSRQLLSVASGTQYLVATGFGGASSTGLTAGSYVSNFDTSHADQIWAVSSGYASPYQGTIGKWKNLGAAAPSLQLLLSDQFLVSDAAFAAITGDLENATPDAVLNQARSSMDTATFTANTALRMAFTDPKADSRVLLAYHGAIGTSDLAPALGGPVHWKPRVWGGYIGNFTRVDTHGGYRGYDADMHGFIAGLNLDSPNGRASFGAYCGYTSAETDTKGSNSGIDTDSVYLGLLGRVVPMASAPEFSVTVDAAFSRHDNDSKRDVLGAGASQAEFNQHVWSAGLGLEYELDLSNTLLTPFFSVRYSYLDQESAQEMGGLTDTRTRGVYAHSFTSDIGAETAWDIGLESGAISPYLRASWRHEYADRQYTARSRYALDNHYMGELPFFTMKTGKFDRDSANLGTGARALFDAANGGQWGLNLGYNANISANQVGHSVSALFEWRF